MKVYYDKDADAALVKEKKIAVIGYGSQGHAHANNLKDSGAREVKVALREESSSIRKAQDAGFEVLSPSAAAKWADIVMVLVPDELQEVLYKEHLEDNLKQGAAIAFAHGLAIHFKLIVPRDDLDVFMIAPKGPGHTVRAQYLDGKGVPSLLAVQKDASGNAHKIALSYASAIGAGRTGIIETTFKEECETDLFGEQAVLCGGLTSLVKSGFETLVDAGYSPEMAYFECLHEMKLIVDLMYEGGIANMRYSISNTAEYGDYVSGPRVINDAVRKEMKKLLDEIQSGDFVKKWMQENKNNQKKFKEFRTNEAKHPIEEVGKKLRDMMPWIAAGKLVDRNKN